MERLPGEGGRSLVAEKHASRPGTQPQDRGESRTRLLVGSACPLLVISRSAAVPSAPSTQRPTPLDPSRSSYATGCQAPALLSRMNFCCADLVGEGYLAWKCVLPWKKTVSPVLCSLNHSSWCTVVTIHPLVGKKAQRYSEPSRGCTASS